MAARAVRVRTGCTCLAIAREGPAQRVSESSTQGRERRMPPTFPGANAGTTQITVHPPKSRKSQFRQSPPTERFLTPVPCPLSLAVPPKRPKNMPLSGQSGHIYEKIQKNTPVCPTYPLHEHAAISLPKTCRPTPQTPTHLPQLPTYTTIVYNPHLPCTPCTAPPTSVQQFT